MIDWHDIEDLAYEAEQLAVLSMTIDDAMNYGPSTPDAYFGALSLLTTMAQTHAKKLDALYQKEPKNSKEG